MSNAIGSVGQTQKQNLGHQLPYYLFSEVQEKEEKAQEMTGKKKDQYWRAFKNLRINSDLTWDNEAESSFTNFFSFFQYLYLFWSPQLLALQMKYMDGVLCSHKISVFLSVLTYFIICLSFWVNHIAFSLLLAKWSFRISLLVEYSAYGISLLVGILCRWFSVEQKQVHAIRNAINIINNPLQTKKETL